MIDGLLTRRKRLARRSKVVVGSTADRVVARVGQPFIPIEKVDVARVQAETETALGLYEARRMALREPLAVHRALQRPTTILSSSTRRVRGLDVTSVEFDPEWSPPHGDPGATRWIEKSGGRHATVRILEHAGAPRPWVVCVHGTAMGFDAIDLAGFRVGWLHHELGFNVALPVLPGSGRRRAPGGPAIQFPSYDQMDSLHGLLQATAELDAILEMLRGRGAEEISVTGISLGAYLTAVLASVTSDLTRAIPGIPLADLQLLFHESVPRSRTTDHARMLALGRRLHTVVSPIDLEPLVAPEGRFMYIARGDRIVPARSHGRPLWEWWGRPASCWFAGGHVSFARSRRVRAFLSGVLGTARHGHAEPS